MNEKHQLGIKMCFFFSCICESAEKRPDIVEVASAMADKLMVYIDSMATQQTTMEKKLEKERHKAQR